MTCSGVKPSTNSRHVRAENVKCGGYDTPGPFKPVGGCPAAAAGRCDASSEWMGELGTVPSACRGSNRFSVGIENASLAMTNDVNTCIQCIHYHKVKAVAYS